MVESSKLSSARTYQTASDIQGPLVFVEKTRDVGYAEIVKITGSDGTDRTGQVLEITENMAVIQVFEGTRGLDVSQATRVRFLGETIKIALSNDILGRVFSGKGDPIDGGPPIVPDEYWDITGSPINPYARQYPREFIQTGISVIDGMNTLVRGQKLPLFSGSGLPHNLCAAQIARQAKVLGEEEEFAVIFCAMGITAEEARFFRNDFERSGALERVVLFLNLADDPAVERLITPRFALTAAEYLAYEHDYQMLVILTDLTNYAEALREISAAREEVPGRRGYPGYLYSDLATIYERAGRIQGRRGSITQMPILTMPSDDKTHPVPDLTGYITEGQMILDRGLHRKGLYPPLDPLPSLSRLMKEAIGKGYTHESHREASDSNYAGYAEGRNIRDLVAVVGEEALTPRDRKYLEFADAFEQKMINQGFEDRNIEDTLSIMWDLLAILPERELKRCKPDTIQKWHPAYRTEPIVPQLEKE
ncbi:MAG: V-type ATP synthase subunit B [Candidatus Hodarchaeota archaeon]